MQEEACILGAPCVTLRDNTKRPETLEVGSNVLAGVNQRRILEGAKLMLNKQTFKKSLAKNAAHASRNWKNLFGDGKAGEKIVGILQKP